MNCKSQHRAPKRPLFYTMGWSCYCQETIDHSPSGIIGRRSIYRRCCGQWMRKIKYSGVGKDGFREYRKPKYWCETCHKLIRPMGDTGF